MFFETSAKDSKMSKQHSRRWRPWHLRTSQARTPPMCQRQPISTLTSRNQRRRRDVLAKKVERVRGGQNAGSDAHCKEHERESKCLNVQYTTHCFTCDGHHLCNLYLVLQ